MKISPEMLVFYALVILISFFAALAKKTSWWSVIIVAIMPPFFLWVLWDLFRAMFVDKEESNSEGTETNL